MCKSVTVPHGGLMIVQDRTQKSIGHSGNGVTDGMSHRVGAEN